MRLKSLASNQLRARLMVAACAAMCTAPALASSLDRIDREAEVAIGKQMIAAGPAAGVAALPPAASAEPRFRNFSQPLPAVQKGKVLTPEGVARTHLGQLDSGRAKSATDSLLQVRNVSTLGNGAHIVHFDTRVQGVEVFRRSVKVLVDAEQSLRAISGIWPPVADDVVAKTSRTWSLRAEDALAAALAGYGFDPASTGGAARATQKSGGPYLQLSLGRAVTGAKQERLQSSRAKQVLFPLGSRLIPAWYVETVVDIDGGADAEYYAHVVDALDGAILFRHPQTEDAEFQWQVWADSSPPYKPYQNPHTRDLVPYPFFPPSTDHPPLAGTNHVVLQNSPYSFNDPWLPASATDTLGNNVEAYVDTGNDGYEPGIDFRSPVFPVPGPAPAGYDATQDPAASQAQREAALRQMFFVVNWLHDWFYDAGFNEATGNAQFDNFGRGGLGGDAIRAEAQDNTGSCAPDCRNSSNMSTPADGAPPRLQMYIFDPTSLAKYDWLSPSATSSFVGLPSWSFESFNLTGEVVQALDDAGTPAGSTTTDGCTTFTNATSVAGRIAFVDRGTCDFAVKVKNAIEAGAAGVLVGNVSTSFHAGSPPAMGCESDCPDPAFAVLSLKIEDADSMRAALAGGTVSGRLVREVRSRRDSSIDNQRVAHELGHYISNRLIEDASGLTTRMSRGLGEGWADFHAMMLTIRQGDGWWQMPEWHTTYALDSYTSGNFYHGLRRYPYSARLAVNPLTLKHIQSGIPLPASPWPAFAGDNAEVHNAGEVWATALWECYVSLLQALPFADAQDRMKRYLINGYKLTPPAPLVTEARDALLAAVHAEDSVDFQRFTIAFSKRGLGIAAQTPDRYGTTNAGTLESFQSGGRVSFGAISADDNAACDNDGVLDSGETGTLTIPWANSGWSTLSGSSLQVTSSFPGLTFGGAMVGNASVPATEPFQIRDVVVPVQLSGAPADGLITITATPFDPGLSVPSSAQLTFRVDYDNLPASSATETFGASTLAWNRRLTDGAIPLKEWQLVNEGGQRMARAPAVGAAGVAWIESPDIVVGNAGFRVALAHRHRFESDGLHHDGGVIEISSDGGATWNAVTGSASAYGSVLSDCCGNPLQGRDAFVADSTGYPAFTHSTLDFGSSYDGQVVRLRFGVAEDEAVGSAGWDIDTVTLTGATNLPFPSTTWQGQACGAPSSNIEVTPGTLAATLPAGGQSSASFSIGNVGVGHLHWSVAEACNAPAEVSWLSLGRTEGTTLTGNSTSVPVMFDANGLDPGTYSALLCIDSNDRNEPRALKPVMLTVTNGTPSFTSTPVTQASVGVPYLYALVATDPSPADTLTITAVQKPEWLVLDAVPGTRTASLSGTPGAADAGSHAVVVQVSDGMLSAQQSFSIVVNAAPGFTSTPVTTAVQDSAYSYSVTASDPNAGDTLTITATVSPDWLDLADAGDGTAILAGTPDLDNLGVHPVVLVVTDAAGLSAQQSFSITVATGNSVPVAVGSIGTQDNDEGDGVTLDVSGAFDDADPSDTLTYSAAGLPPGLSIGVGTGIIGGTLGFDTAGAYSVTITASDSAGASADQQFAWTVNDVVLPPQVFADGFEDN